MDKIQTTDFRPQSAKRSVASTKGTTDLKRFVFFGLMSEV